MVKTMKLSICIPVMNQIEDTKGQWGCHIANVQDKKNVELVVINNGSTDGTTEFIEKFVFPYFPDHKMVMNKENVGVLASMNQCYKESKGDIVAILHNDLYVFDQGWDNDVVNLFTSKPNCGLAGFLGSEGIGENGGRINTMSNMLEAEIHGLRREGIHRVVQFDGLSLIASRAMLDKVGGFDMNYTYHHFYDRDISLASHYGGFENWFIGISCHHRSGVTANRPEYQKWIDQKMNTKDYTGDRKSYNQSEQYFFSKWQGKLPLWIRNQS